MGRWRLIELLAERPRLADMPDPANRLTVDNATVISGGVETSAATVHLIDRILVPPTVARMRQPARYPVPAIRTGGSRPRCAPAHPSGATRIVVIPLPLSTGVGGAAGVSAGPVSTSLRQRFEKLEIPQPRNRS